LAKAPKKVLSIQILVVVEHHVKVMVEDNKVTMATIINNKKVNPKEVEEETLREGGVVEIMVKVIEVNNQAVAQIAIIARNLNT
jgi:hypothetical protein